MAKMLTKPFFDRPTLTVARELLGKYIVRKYRGREIAVIVTEVEAYDGPRDLASHAKSGRTPRTLIMFGEAGRIYVFFTYGMHWMMNVVTGPKEYPAAILFRAGIYKDKKAEKEIAVTGPARLTKFLKIDGAMNGRRAARATGLWFEDRGVEIPRSKIIVGKRIGVDYAGPIWSEKKWNLKIKPES